MLTWSVSAVPRYLIVTRLPVEMNFKCYIGDGGYDDYYALRYFNNANKPILNANWYFVSTYLLKIGVIYLANDY